MIGKTISHYKILEKLGEGGMGVVYKAEDTNLKRTVALKFLSPQAVGSEEDKKRFVREAQAAAALDHPNICTVYEIEQAEGHTFIAMAYLDGQSLKEKVEAKPLKLDEALDIAMQVADGLHEAHESGIVHRDIKSSNVMVTTKGQAILMDFGLARQAGRTMITKEGTSMGTVAYMSPEQAQGAAVDHRTDIWSFGVMLYEMVTGQLPFKGDYEQAVMYSIMNEDAEPMTGLRTGVPMELERIVNKAIAKNPDERYQNANDMLIDLRSVAKELEAETSKTRVTTAVRPEKVESISLIRDLFARRVPQILGLYFGASFAIIQFVQWLIDNYPVSPNLDQFSFVAMASMIPTVLFLAYFHGKPGRDQWTRVEKIGIPVNLVAAIALIFFVFQGKELGATTTTVTVQDETGQTIERVIPTSGFRKSLALFFFENESGDSTLNWLQYAVPLMLTFDLYQDLFLDITPGYDCYEKMKEAGFSDGIGLPLTLENKIADDLHKKYFITGSFNKQDNEYTVEILIYETERGKLLAENVFQNTDIFKLVDEISVALKHELDIPEGHIEEVKDHPISETLTNSLPAFELFIAALNSIVFDQNWTESLKYLEQTVKEDPTFALAYFQLQLIYMVSNQSEKAAQLSGPLMQHLYRLPERIQLQFKFVNYFNIKQNAERAFNVVKMWADLYPNDLDAHTALAGIYEQRNQTEEAVAEYKRILELDPAKYNIVQTIGSLYKEKGDYEEALKYYKQYAEKFPNKYESFTAIGGLYRTLGDYEQAKTNYEKALIIEPEKISVLRSLAVIESNLGHFEQALDQYREALEICKTPSDSAAVYNSLRSLHELRGQLVKAIDNLHLFWAMNEKFAPPAGKLLKKLSYGALATYIKAGKQDLAFQTIAGISAQLQPPFDKFLPLGYLDIYLELEDADNAEKAIEGVETMIQTFQFEALRSYVFFKEGQIREIRNGYDQAIESYQKALELDPTDAKINRYIGRCFRKLHEFKKAEEFIHETLEIKPFDPKAHYEIALVYYEMGQKDKALEHLKRALYVWEDADPEFKYAKKAIEKLAEWEPVTSKL